VSEFPCRPTVRPQRAALPASTGRGAARLRHPVGDVTSLAPPSEIPWLQPYPDSLPAVDEPDALVVARETIELAYLAAIQLLPPTQRAVLILRDVLDWSAAETAELLDTSVLVDRPSIRKTRTRRL